MQKIRNSLELELLIREHELKAEQISVNMDHIMHDLKGDLVALKKLGNLAKEGIAEGEDRSQQIMEIILTAGKLFL